MMFAVPVKVLIDVKTPFGCTLVVIVLLEGEMERERIIQSTYD